MPLPIHNQRGTEIDVKAFNKGASYSIDEQFLGQSDSGAYIDAENMRPTGLNADEMALSIISGEEIEYISSDNSCNGYYGTNFANGAWRCLGTIFVKGKIVELWCDETPDVPPGTRLDPFIRIDGVIYAASPQLPIDIDYPVQFHWNNTCLGGEIYITDNRTPPIILNVQDMIDSSNPVCTEKYFTEFDRRKYEVNTQIPPHMMSFVELTPSPGYPADKVIGSVGLKVGMYSYSFRYVTTSGDRTAWTNVTPTIPVPVQVNTQSTQYPSIKTFGADPNTQSGYGIVLNFRIQNELGYDYIEIKRYSYNNGVPVGFTPSAELIGTLSLVDGENVVKFIVDFGAVGEPITDEDDTVQYGPIEACKTLRYFENRLHLMNVRYASMDFTTTFVTNGRPNLFPVMAPLGTIGYNEAYYATYYRSLFRGEKYGFGVGFWNTLMGQSFATPVTGFTNYQLPDRRDEIITNSINDTYSYTYAGATTLPIASVYQTNSNSKCYETYSLVNAVTKNDCCGFRNIACNGSKGTGCDGGIGIDGMPAFCGCGSVATPTQAGDVGYKPLTPTSERDASITGQDYVINTRVESNCNSLSDFHPAGFAPEYFALGVALNGIDDSLLPPYIQAFSVLRTKPAGRVVFQGIGGYYLYPNPGGSNDPAHKALDKLWFYSFEASARSGLISQQVINAIGTNSGSRYEAQLVSPVGIFPEIPHGENRTLFGGRDWIDMCLYPRFYEDNTTINLAPDPTSTGGYVQFGKWRNPTFPGWVTNLNTDRASFVLNEFRSANNAATDTSGIGSEYLGDRGNQFFVLGTTTAVYNVGSVGLNACDNAYGNADLKSFHEPWYNINIIDTLANIPATDVTTYYDTGAYQKLRSWVGTYTPSNTIFVLAGDERWEDIRPWKPNNIPTGTVAEVDTNTINSIIQIERPDGTIEYYLNVDGVSAGAVTALSALLPFTIGAGATSKPNVTISGLYGTTFATSPYPRIYSIVFNAGSTPVTGSKVIIKYDNEVPVKAFGGDVYTGDDTACFVDRQIPNGGGNPAGTGANSPLPLNLGLPYYEIQVNPRMFITQDAEGGNKIQDCSKIKSDWVRQMIALFNCESRIHLPYNYEAPITDPPSFQMGKFFPATNYIMRPNQWETTVENDNFCGGSGIIYDNYKSDYPSEWLYWKYGGYRYQPQFNIDYMHIQNVTFWTTKPTTGFKELTDFCTRDAYSLKREIARVDSPGIRTFLAQNVYDLDDQTGEIKFAWSALGGNKGNNLYAFTERGICLLLTEDAIIRDATGEQIAMGLVAEGKVIGGEYWISREIGMNEESWRSRAEYNNSLWFLNKTSAYLFNENETLDIARKFNYFAKIIQYLNAFGNGYSTWITSCYDTKHEEYMVQIQNTMEETQLFVFSQKNQAWNGRYSYRYDQFLSFDNKTYGMGRWIDGDEAGTYLLDSGDSINNANVQAKVWQSSAKNQILAKEFQGIRVSSNQVPTKVNLFDNVQQAEAGTVQCFINGADLRNYGSAFEQYIGRRIVTGNDNRMQGTAIVYEITYDGGGDFKIVSSGIYWKPLV